MAMLVTLALCSPMLAQQARWEMRQITTAGYNKFRPSVAIDSWGTTHMLWASLDHRRAGIQLFYTTDASGRFSSPIQATDTGTAFDTAASLDPWLLRLDAAGWAHIGFIANTDNRISLCYTSNREDRHGFAPARVLADVAQYGMAVDSLGAAHFVWTEMHAGVASFMYWNSASGEDPRMIGTLRCYGPGGNLWRISSPAVEIGPEGLIVAVRSDSGGVYMTRGMFDGGFSPVARIECPSHDEALRNAVNGDVRLRMAVDADGAVHIVAPQSDRNGRVRLYYLADVGGAFDCRPLGDPLDGAVNDIGLFVAGRDRLHVTWNASRTGRASEPARIGFAELASAGKGLWDMTSFVTDLAAVSAGSQGLPLIAGSIGIGSTGNRVAIAGLAAISTDSARQQTVLLERLDLQPRVRYLLPDAAAPGMNVVMEAYAHPRDRGGFGADGFHGDDVRFEIVHPADTGRVMIGPSVVSWHGRLVSTMIFVKEGARPGAVPLRLRVGGVLSNVDTFFVVEPQHIGGSAGRLDGGGALGSGGIYGMRSRRGVLVVDSLILASGTFTVDTADIDPATPGNQGFLPVTILARGPVRIGAGATLSVAARNDLANGLYGSGGPGGGGGGAGGERGVGSGYTGGGGIARLNRTWLMGASSGSGGERSGIWNGGGSLNGAPGGETFTDVPGGGGTGHPFGTSGLFGKATLNHPFFSNPGGYGGGTGGAITSQIGTMTAGGGGGGHGSAGASGGGPIEDNHGFAVGSRQLVPLSGGSGGGGGGYGSAGYASGGGGGGALALYSFATMTIDGAIDADGAPGIDAPQAANGSGGGGGAGGGILIGAQGPILLGAKGRVHAEGGAGGKGYGVNGISGRDGGNGGAGRVRVDGRMSGDAQARYAPAPGYIGPGTAPGASVPMRSGSTVLGSGMPGSRVRVFMAREGEAWNYESFREVTVGADSVWSLTLGAEADASRLYIVAMQRVAKPSAGMFAYEPEWVMSTAGGSSLGRPAIALDAAGVEFPCIRFNTCDSSSLTVRNIGYTSELAISSLRITGAGASAFKVGPAGIRVSAGSGRAIGVTFCPTDTGRFEANLEIGTNTYPDTLHVVRLSGCATTGMLLSSARELDLGAICIGACRDTVVRLRNDGRASLTVSGVAGDAPGLSALPLAPALPFAIAPGDSVDLHLRLCPKNFDAGEMLLRFTSTAIDPVLTIKVKGTNIGPSPELPASLDFGTIAEGSSDPCPVRTLTIRNRNRSGVLRLQSFTLISDQFRLIDPAPGAIDIPAGGSIELPMRFCEKAVGDYRATARMIFAGGSCSLDTSVALTGGVISHRARIALRRPLDRSLAMKPALVDQTTPEETILLVNLGNAPASIASPVIVSPAGEIAIAAADQRARVLLPDDSLLIHVTMTPKALGRREGSILLRSDDGLWSEVVKVVGEGLKPGIMVDSSSLDFGNVRAGRGVSPHKEVMVFNTGTAPVRVDSIHLTGAPEFVMTFTSSTFPMTLKPAAEGLAGDTLRILYEFAPQNEGPHQATLRVFNSSEQQPSVRFSGNGVMEHLKVDRSDIDFGCLLPGEQLDNVITYTNTGTHAMQLREVKVSGDDASFSVRKGKGTDLLKPGESRTDTIRFIASAAPGNAALVVEGSAPENYTVPLTGRICAIDERTIRLQIPNRTARVGAYVNIPILVRLPRAVTAPLPYSIRISYAYDLLAPLVAPRADARPVILDGSISSDASMIEGKLGELMIGGTIAPGRVSDTLLTIPFKVLLGSVYRTDVSFVDAVLTMPTMRLEFLPGLFEAVDCDTTGTLIVLGAYSLGQNSPNPFNRLTVIPYAIAHSERVTLTLYNDKGDVVRRLLDQVQPAGRHEYRLEDPSLPSGIYTYEIVSGPYRKTRRMVVIE